MAAVQSEKAPSSAPAASAPSMPVPNFSDIGKAANDLVNKDFYHVAQANLEVKLKTPNGSNLTVKGKQSFDGVTTGSVEGKHTPAAKGMHNNSPPSTSPTRGTKRKFIQFAAFSTRLPCPAHSKLSLVVAGLPDGSGEKQKVSLTGSHAGVTINGTFTTASLLDTKIELTDVVAPGVKIDLQNIMSPSEKVPTTQKLSFAYKQPGFHSRAFFTHVLSDGNIDAVVDATAGHEGFLIGGEAGYNVQKAAITRYSVAAGYQAPYYSATITGTQNLSLIAASFYQRVNPSTEVGVKTGYDLQGAKATGVEIAAKYKLDPLSFAKAKMNDRGIAALAYSTKLNAGVTLGLGLSLDTNKLNEAGHKIGTNLVFEG